ncbi:hypothetical protein MRX96_029724 [Rhipicephalus microplus]
MVLHDTRPQPSTSSLTLVPLGEALHAAAAPTPPQHDGTCCDRRRCLYCDIDRLDGASMAMERGYSSKQYMCPLCPYTTTRKGNVGLHLIRHSDRHPFLCPVCAKAFKRSYDLKRHLVRMHTLT